MTKEIIVNAGEMESRVAILENGRLMELHIERDPKIVGNIYKGRVTKVLKGMDAAFVDIGIEQNAFLSVSDVVTQEDEEEGGNGRLHRHELPPITQLLHAGQEILVQVVRAPMGTKGARITTRLSLPGRYMVLMLHSGSYVGVSRKIEDPKERQRLRGIANSVRPETYSLIVRTEAEGKSEEELRQDLTFLLDMARKLEEKEKRANAPALVHGDLNLILRLIRDAFTRDVNRLVVDSQSSYENILELVAMISPGLKSRVFLYDEPMPIFHAYNVETEIERTLRRKVWLPSGGHIAIDQAEALIAIDVNTGRFVGSVELSETVLTTNLQAAEEVARQLRLRDLGGIIVVDFIDMDNPRHRQQVIKAFEEALKRDRAKIKVHNISALGLVEMTRKRTGESLAGLLTETCPYCSGIGRVQNAVTMALRIQRDIAANAVEYPTTEAFSITAHPRVIASVLGYEGEVHRDLESYVDRPVYLRTAEDFHPNTYLVERMTLEQALVAVPHLEEGDIVEGRVVNPDPALSLSPLVMAKGIYIVVPEFDAPVGALVKVRVTQTGTSVAFGEPLAEELRGVRVEQRQRAQVRPPLLPETILPAYLREERASRPPRELSLLSPTAGSSSLPLDEEAAPTEHAEPAYERGLKRRRRGGRRGRELPEQALELPPAVTEEAVVLPFAVEVEPGETAAVLDAAVDGVLPVGEELTGDTLGKRRRRRRRRRNGRGTELEGALETALTAEEEAAEITAEAEAEPATEAEPAADQAASVEAMPVEAVLPEEIAPHPRRRSRRSRHKVREESQTLPEMPNLEPIREVISPEQAEQTLQHLLDNLPESETAPEITSPHPEVTAEDIAALELATELLNAEELATEKPRRTRRRRPRRTEETAAPSAEPAVSEEPAAVEDTAVSEEPAAGEEPAAVPTEEASPVEAAPESVEPEVTEPAEIEPAAVEPEEAELAAAEPAAEAAAEPAPEPEPESEPEPEPEPVAPKRRRPSRRRTKAEPEQGTDEE
ncbi:MAG: Rne/Rng family ribonuclease [Armatimonadota bacterium]